MLEGNFNGKESSSRKTKGYRNHPQLIRFKSQKNPIKFINAYLNNLYLEAKKRDYNFNSKKINKTTRNKLEVANKQLEYEFTHLLKKLRIRDPKKFREIKNTKRILPNPLFKIKKGQVEIWEIIRP